MASVGNKKGNREDNIDRMFAVMKGWMMMMYVTLVMVNVKAVKTMKNHKLKTM